MISALTGEVIRVEDDRLHLAVGPVLAEVMVPAFDIERLRSAVGKQVTFQTIFYFEGDSGGGSIEPRLIGFTTREEKRFFELFITVKGIGPKKALRALTRPMGDIASAIESRDTRRLVELPQIGKRLAELIVAELAGKLGAFAVPTDGGSVAVSTVGQKRIGEDEDAIQTLMALGEKRNDAETLLDRVRATFPELKKADALVREMLRLRSSRG